MNYQGRLAVITGASSGIGLAFARELHRRGCNVVLVARRKDLLDQETVALNKLRPGSASAFTCDLTNKNEREGLIVHLQSLVVDIFINNAGRGTFGVFPELMLADELSMIELNVVAFTVLNHAIAAQMQKRRSGLIVGVSSIGAFQPLPYLATYSATKAFEFNQLMALAAELKEYNVQVRSLNPGPVATEFAGVARVPGTATGYARDSAETVVVQCLSSIERGNWFNTPGWGSWMLSICSRLLPTRLTTLLAAHLVRPALAARQSA